MTTFADRVYQMGGTPVGGVDWSLGVENWYYVDVLNGSDSNNGSSWSQAFATIAQAITTSNATINWSYAIGNRKYNAILVAPGVYPENLTSSPYYCHLVGMGIRGTDTATEIHPTTGSCLADTLLGCHIANIRFEVNTAVPCLDIGICNSTTIEYSTFTNGAAVGATAIDTENSTHLTVRYCSVESGQGTGMAYGFYHRGGANKFVHNARIHDNVIHCTTAGIFIQNTCTASNYVAWNNFIARPTKGIDDNSGQGYFYNNYITASSDAIEHANSATQCIGNHVINNATGAVEASSTD